MQYRNNQCFSCNYLEILFQEKVHSLLFPKDPETKRISLLYIRKWFSYLYH